MRSVTKTGNVLKTSFRLKIEEKADPRGRIGLCSTEYCGKLKLALHGAICLSGTAHGRRFTHAFANGRLAMFLKKCSNCWAVTRICKIYQLTVPLAKPINTQQAQKRGWKCRDESGYRAVVWRKKYKNSRCCRRAGKSGWTEAHSRQRERLYGSCSGFIQCRNWRQCSNGWQGVWHKRNPWTRWKSWSQLLHSAESERGGTMGVRFLSVQGTTCCRVFFQQAQTISSCSHTVR